MCLFQSGTGQARLTGSESAESVLGLETGAEYSLGFEIGKLVKSVLERHVAHHYKSQMEP